MLQGKILNREFVSVDGFSSSSFAIERDMRCLSTANRVNFIELVIPVLDTNVQASDRCHCADGTTDNDH